MSRILWRRQARRDVVEISDYLAQTSLRVARRFRDSAEKTMLKLLGRPFLGARWETENPNYQDVRCCPVSGFPNHLIFYRLTDEGIEIYRVIHGSRDMDAIFGEG